MGNYKRGNHEEPGKRQIRRVEGTEEGKFIVL